MYRILSNYLSIWCDSSYPDARSLGYYPRIVFIIRYTIDPVTPWLVEWWVMFPNSGSTAGSASRCADSTSANICPNDGQGLAVGQRQRTVNTHSARTDLWTYRISIRSAGYGRWKRLRHSSEPRTVHTMDASECVPTEHPILNSSVAIWQWTCSHCQ